MADQEKLQAYVVESKDWGPRRRPVPEDYSFDEVVGIKTAGHELWVPNREREALHASERVLTVDEVFQSRMLGWMTRRIAQERVDNCHSFADAIANGSKEPDLYPDLDVIRHGELVTRLALGQKGVLGVKIASYGPTETDPKSPHSVVGLGVEDTDCIQVMYKDGPLAMSTIDTIVSVYEPRISAAAEGPEFYDYGLYALDEAA